MLSPWKKSFLLIFSSLTISSIERCVYEHVWFPAVILVAFCPLIRRQTKLYRLRVVPHFSSEIVERAKKNHFSLSPPRVAFSPVRWFSRALAFCTFYKGAWNGPANNSETVGHKDLRFGQIVYILVFYNIHFLGFFHWTVSNLSFLCRVYCVTVKTKNSATKPTENVRLKIQEIHINYLHNLFYTCKSIIRAGIPRLHVGKEFFYAKQYFRLEF